jgi:hypothetical protein
VSSKNREIAFFATSQRGKCIIYRACLTRFPPGIPPGNSPQRSTSHPCCWSTSAITRMLRGHRDQHASHRRQLARSTSQRITNACSQACDRQLCRPASYKRCYSNEDASAGSRVKEAAMSVPPYVRLLCLSSELVRRPPTVHTTRLPP